MTRTMRGLIIKPPYAGLISSGVKTWEMRSGQTHVRGMVAIIEKGAKVVIGVANLIESLPPLHDFEAFKNAHANHRIKPFDQPEAHMRGWIYPWVFGGAGKFETPIPVKWESGWQTWATLTPEQIDFGLLDRNLE